MEVILILLLIVVIVLILGLRNNLLGRLDRLESDITHLSQPMRMETAKGFFERYPDLEKFIGENLISKIGIAILVLAIGFFVKYAIDNDWIGPAEQSLPPPLYFILCCQYRTHNPREQEIHRFRFRGPAVEYLSLFRSYAVFHFTAWT